MREPGGYRHPNDKRRAADRHDRGTLTRLPLARSFGRSRVGGRDQFANNLVQFFPHRGSSDEQFHPLH